MPSCRPFLSSLALAVWLVACDSTEDPKVFLGPVAASPTATAPPPVYRPGDACPASQPAAPDLDPLEISACAGNLTQVTGTPGLTSTEDGFAVGTGGEVSLSKASGGCPGSSSGPSVAVQGLTGALAWEGGRLWAARGSSVDVIEKGEVQASCELGGARSLAAAGGQGWALTGRGVIPLQLDGGVCTVGEPLALGASTALALAAGEGGGLWVVEAAKGCGGGLSVVKHLEDGSASEDAPFIDATLRGLCSVTALVERGGKLTLVDGTCRRVVTVDSTSGEAGRLWEAPAGQALVGVAGSASGVLLATSAPGAQGSTVRFYRATPLFLETHWRSSERKRPPPRRPRRGCPGTATKSPRGSGR